VDAALLVAKIVLPPREFHPYVKGVHRKLVDFLDRGDALHKKLSALDTKQRGKSGYEQSVLDGWEVQPGGHWPDELVKIPIDPKGYLGKDIYRDSEDIPRLLDTIKKQDEARSQLDFIKYLVKDFERIAEELKKHRDRGVLAGLLGAKNWVDQTWAEYAGEYGPYKEYVEEGLKRLERKDFEEIDRYLRDFDTVTKLVTEAKDRVMQVHTQAYQKYYDAEWMPEHEKIETLYHTSVHATSLYRGGFEKRVPGPKGLGGAQSDKCGKPAISFTSDLYVAKEVMRGLKEAIMVAKGQVRLKHVIEWAKKAGVGSPVLKSIQLNKYGDDPAGVMFAYREYMGLQTKRYNPLFFGDMRQLMKDFKQLNPKDVGILVCDVDMGNKCIGYIATMQEYRVPPDAVVKIKKLIKG